MSEEPAGASERRWIKREAWTEVWVEDGVCTKRYRVERWLRWRTFLRRSRGRREAERLAALRAAGLPAVEPLGASERRRFGCVVESSVRTRWIDEARNLRAWLRAPDGDAAQLARDLGALLARVHEAGFVWNTASPRNWLLVPKARGRFELFLCDPVLCVPWPRSVHGRRPGFGDLYDLALGASRRREMTRAFRYRIVLAYCRGDRELARRLFARIGRWPRFIAKQHKGAVILAGHLFERSAVRVGSRAARGTPSGCCRSR